MFAKCTTLKLGSVKYYATKKKKNLQDIYSIMIYILIRIAFLIIRACYSLKLD